MSAMMRGNVRMALSGVRGSKWRSLLTMLGVIVGIVAVVTVVGIGEGVKKQVAGQMGYFGKNLITVRPSQATQNKALQSLGGPNTFFGGGSIAGLSSADVDVVLRSTGVVSASPLGAVSGVVKVGGIEFPSTPVIAAGSQLPEVLNHKIEFGETWKSDNSSFTAIIGKKVAARLFGENVPLGSSFSFRGQTFVVRGMFADFSSIPFSPTAGFDDAIFIPYETAASITQNNASIYAILAKTASQDQIDVASRSIDKKLSNAHGGQKDFLVLGSYKALEKNNGTLSLLTNWIIAVAVISLLIGGIGIMNIMLLTVTERMHEIGVRKAVGATSRQILWQFIIEAAVLSSIGGVAGIALSLVTDGLLYTYTDLKPVISWRAIAIAAMVSLTIGIVFGTIPAAKAARKDPIEALRHE